jgi:hypothetical protein
LQLEGFGFRAVAMAIYYVLALSPLIARMHPGRQIASPWINGCFMAQRSSLVFFAIFAAALTAGSADARSRSPRDLNLPTTIVDASPTLAPFQHVRFCLRYPSNGKSNPTEVERLISTLRPRTDVHQSQRQRVYCSDTQKLWL